MVTIDSEGLTIKGNTSNNSALFTVGSSIGAYLELRNGVICDNTNTSSGSGGGVTVNYNGLFVMSGGEIRSNKASNGAAIYAVDLEHVDQKDFAPAARHSVRIMGGKITGNTAAWDPALLPIRVSCTRPRRTYIWAAVNKRQHSQRVCMRCLYVQWRPFLRE